MYSGAFLKDSLYKMKRQNNFRKEDNFSIRYAHCSMTLFECSTDGIQITEQLITLGLETLMFVLYHWLFNRLYKINSLVDERGLTLEQFHHLTVLGIVNLHNKIL